MDIDRQTARGSDGESSDELLTAWQQSGDREILDRLLRNEIGILKRMLRAKAGGSFRQTLAATDVVHEAVLSMLRAQKTPNFDHPGALRRYLLTAALRLLFGRLEKKGRSPLRLDGTAGEGMEGLLATTGGMNAAMDSDRAAALELSMNLMKPQEREILRLVYFEGMTVPEAARSLDVTTDAANMRLVRGRRSLARTLAGWSELLD